MRPANARAAQIHLIYMHSISCGVIHCCETRSFYLFISQRLQPCLYRTDNKLIYDLCSMEVAIICVIINPANRARAQEEKCDDSKEEMRVQLPYLSDGLFIRAIITTP